MTEVISAAAVLLPCIVVLLHARCCYIAKAAFGDVIIKQQPSWVTTCKIKHNVPASHRSDNQALHGVPVTQLLTRVQSAEIRSDELHRAG